MQPCGRITSTNAVNKPPVALLCLDLVTVDVDTHPKVTLIILDLELLLGLKSKYFNIANN